MSYNVVPAGVVPVGAQGSGTLEQVQQSFGGFSFVLAQPRCVAPGSALSVTLTTSGTSRSYRLVHRSLYIDKGRAHRVRRVVRGKRRTVIVFSGNPVTTKSGEHRLSLAGLGPGAHKLSVVILLRKRTRRHASHSLTLRLPFSVC